MRLLVLLALSSVLVTGCMRDEVQGQLSDSQRNAVKQMETSYAQAKLYNDSLVMLSRAANGSPDMVRMRALDQAYHHHDAAFETCHTNFEHTTTSADHNHSSGGMVQMHGSGSGMMGGGGCQCCNNGGHGAGIHSDMEALHTLHAQYHPH